MLTRRILSRLLTYYVACCVVLGVVLGEVAFRPERVPLTERNSFQVTASRFGATVRDVSVTASDGAVLRAWFARSDRRNGDAVILLHGIGDNRQGMTGFGEMFLSKGYAVLLPDSRAQGASGGNFPTYGLKEADDVQRWFTWLLAEQHSPCVFGMGESMGAAIMLQAVRATPFCAVVAESPFASFRQIAYIRVGQIFHAGPWLGRIALRPAVELGLIYGKLTRGVYLAQASPQDAVAHSTVPIFLIHGLADDNIPHEQSQRIRAQNPTIVSLWEVPRAGHCGAVNVAGDEFNTRVLSWFAAHNTRGSTKRAVISRTRFHAGSLSR